MRKLWMILFSGLLLIVIVLIIEIIVVKNKEEEIIIPSPIYPPQTTLLSKNTIDVTDQIEVLGNPYQEYYPDKDKIYARNIWDMIEYHGQLFIGAGNSSNEGPASNSGPVPLISYIPEMNEFHNIFSVDDEQIDRFRLLNNYLFIPGHDPKESWELGNYYRLENGNNWKKYRNIPSGIHNYDMAYFSNTLFAALGLEKGAGVAISHDFGLTWTLSRINNDRIYSFLVDNYDIYAAGTFTANGEAALYKYEIDTFTSRKDIGTLQLFPNMSFKNTQYLKIIRTEIFQGHSIYIGAYIHNDHQYIPFGIYKVNSLKAGSVSILPIYLPENTRVWDLLVQNDTLYILLDTPNNEGTIVSVAESKDGVNWIELFKYQSTTFARSFAILNGDYYFGLGCEINDPSNWNKSELIPETGDILRITKDY